MMPFGLTVLRSRPQSGPPHFGWFMVSHATFLWNLYKVYWAIKHFNFDLKSAGERRLLQLNELEEIRLDAYKSSRIYKERTKWWHEKFINHREFREGDLVLLFNSRLKFFLGKLRSKWSGPFKVIRIYPYGAIEIGTEATCSFKVNGSGLKPYIAGESLEGKGICYLPDVLSA